MEKDITLGDKYGPAMKMAEQEQADAYFEELVQHNMSFGDHTREEAESVERANLGYFAGYYDNRTRQQVERLFKCSHPIFGSIAAKGPPTPADAFEAGHKRGATARH